jgi:hypothetical protein
LRRTAGLVVQRTVGLVKGGDNQDGISFARMDGMGRGRRSYSHWRSGFADHRPYPKIEVTKRAQT